MSAEQKEKVLVAWSGGVDSTYLIDQYLSQGYEVHALPIKILNNTHQVAREMKARDTMIKRYFNKYNFMCLQSIEISFDQIGDCLIYQQTPFWLMGLIISAKQDYKEVAIGYVMNDDAISHLEEIKQIWNSYAGIAPSLPPLVFPLTKTKKEHAYERLPQELKSLVTWCANETNDKDKCGKCIPCSRMSYLSGRGLINLVSKSRKKTK